MRVSAMGDGSAIALSAGLRGILTASYRRLPPVLPLVLPSAFDADVSDCTHAIIPLFRFDDERQCDDFRLLSRPCFRDVSRLFSRARSAAAPGCRTPLHL